jgi:1,4-dihydroxy-2-naphthoate octaprenyltransferase
MLHPSTIQLLRFHFSLFLLPVYLFALSEAPAVRWQQALLLGFVLHGLVYPASNGYNSYMDRDETPIGGLKHPLQPTRQLFYATVLMDCIALLVALIFLGWQAALGIMLYIAASRAYSYRGIRLKRFPYIGFAVVFIFQGALVYLITYGVATGQGWLSAGLMAPFIASLLIGALYPLTQVYQHEADRQDGVTTISYRLGKRGTFLFSGSLFILAGILFFFWYRAQSRLNDFLLFLLLTGPVVLFFCWWMRAVWQNGQQANFRNSLHMNLVATGCTIIFFSTLIYKNHFE